MTVTRFQRLTEQYGRRKGQARVVNGVTGICRREAWSATRMRGVRLAPFEQGEIGPDPFRAACRMNLEDIVLNRRDRPRRAG